MPNTPVPVAGEAMPAAILNRRSILGGLAAATALVAADTAYAGEHPDAELLRLGTEFDRELALEPELARESHRMFEVWKGLCKERGIDGGRASDEATALIDECGYGAAAKPWGDCHVRLSALAQQIAALPASTLAGVTVKANALLWDMFLWEADADDDDDEAYNIKALRQFISDLHRAGGVS